MSAADAAADVEDDLPQGRAHRDLDEARVVHLAGQGEDLRAGGVGGADLVEPVRALVDDDGDGRERLHVVDDGRTLPEAGDDGVWRLRAGHAALAFDRVLEGRALAADEGAGAEAQLDVEVEAAPEDVVPQKAHLAGLADRDLEALDGEGVFRADVDVALVRAHGVAADDHRLEDGVGIALQGRAVHVRAGVALVRVADHVLLSLGLLGGRLPLDAGGEPGAAAAAEARLLHLGDNLLGRHLEEHLLERLVAVAGDVVLDLLRVDDAAVAEDDAELLLVERDVRLGVGILRLRGVVAEAADDAALDEMLGDDLLDVLRLHMDVERALRHDLHDRALLAEAEAAGVEHLHLAVEALGLELVPEFGDDLVRAARAARRAAAHENMGFDGHFLSPPSGCRRTAFGAGDLSRSPCRPSAC